MEIYESSVSVIAAQQSEPPSITPSTVIDATVPLSFPLLLRNSGIKDRYAYLYDSKPRNTTGSTRSYKKNKRDDNEGRRWVRRKENARFIDNPYIALPTKKDYALPLTELKTTFPEPLPPYLQRNTKIPATSTPLTDPISADAGRFSFSIKGMRRDLRRAGHRAEHLVREVEAEILEWLDAGGVTLNPDVADSIDYSGAVGHPVADTGSIVEVFRTPQQLIWRISDDAFARYVVHCCARYHNVVSFSKEVSGSRLTYLLRPNVSRPDRQAAASLNTPPMTDLDVSSHLDSDTDFGSSAFADSDVESVISQPGAVAADNLSDIDEGLHSDSWSVIGDSDADGELSEADHPLTSQFGSLSLRARSEDPERTLEAISARALRHISTSNRWQAQRSSSSPSCSPARAAPRRLVLRSSSQETKTLYAYLYS
ncbi:hypothetical protein J3R30DRAFT_1679066 [Lentinula aciculospora]|uniref:Uncharacterized protein n=1 Tax=Lentinula aciculospora TaxID=153920 RepID=A0A9W8ZWK6_9AGAR|nr:hypothetical protein J3R30DRAFT_1679066 [Lentinula aciculospora]